MVLQEVVQSECWVVHGLTRLHGMTRNHDNVFYASKFIKYIKFLLCFTPLFRVQYNRHIVQCVQQKKRNLGKSYDKENKEEI